MINQTPQSNSFFTYSQKTGDILIEAQPFYIEDRSDPENDHFFYAYKVQVTNLGQEMCQLTRRHWLIRDGKGSQTEVEGAGVVGEQPEISAGTSYNYTSFCPLDTRTGNMRGNFLFVDKKGNKFSATIPVFFFRQPGQPELSH